MLRKCYGYHGWRGTSSGEVLRQAREAQAQTQAHGQALAHRHARIYVRANKLEAGKLGAGKLAN